jgi:hypothetical protein
MLKVKRIRLEKDQFQIDLEMLTFVQGVLSFSVWKTSTEEEIVGGSIHKDKLLTPADCGQFAYDMWRALTGRKDCPTLVAAFTALVIEQELEQLKTDQREVEQIAGFVNQLVSSNR